MSGCYVVANPGAPFKTIFKVNCAIAVPRVENEKPVVNRASSGLRRASGCEILYFLPTARFLKNGSSRN